VSPNLAELAQLSNHEFNPEALYFYVTRGGIGIDPFRKDVHELLPATVTRFHGGQIDSRPYLDWGEFLELRPMEPREAEERFLRIASEYLGAVLKDRSQVACLLSGGVDSALMAWLLKNLGKDVVCLTADYPWKRYSEFTEASRHAAELGLKQERVLVTRRGHREAFRKLNSSLQDAPCCHSQSPSLYQLASHAAASGIDRLVTGDHADALFLGFERFFRGFPQDAEGYRRAISAMPSDEKLARLFSKPQLSADRRELLAALGMGEGACFEWQTRIYRDDSRQMAQWADQTALPVLQQLNGQIWAGISWRNIFLPVTQAFGDRPEFVSPFYDLEMVKFALSLPIEYKFRDGDTKALIRTVLRRVLNRDIVKRASPNPSRVWSLLPNPQDYRAMIPRLRPLYHRLYVSNLRLKGALHAQLDKIAALGMWLASQRFQGL
jgi:asparagine synthase (glutamine-hydrolysing)